MVKQRIIANETEQREFIKGFADLISKEYGDVDAIE